MKLKPIYLFLAILMVWACGSPDAEMSHVDQMLANAPDAGIAKYDNHDAFEVALGSYKDSAVIKFCVVNDPPNMSREETMRIIEGACDKWANAIDKPFVLVDSFHQANLVFEFAFMDGIGGQLGEAQYPPYSAIRNWNRSILIDAYDVHRDSEMDAVKIVAHEVGHGIGLKHSKIRKSILYDFYDDEQDIGIDDQFGARIHYDNKKKFQWDGREYIPIEDSAESLTENFEKSEFFSACTEFPYDFHFLDEKLVSAIQIIRSYYGQPIQIISSYRHYDCNRVAGGATLSRHLQAQALDFRFVGRGWEHCYDDFIRDVKGQGCLFQTLVNNGIGGFGAYRTSFHIDTRRDGLHRWANLRYAVWGAFLEGAFYLDTEHPDGVSDL